MSIKLSPKHGLNPTIATCFYCGKDKNELILAGKINKKRRRNAYAHYNQL